MIRLTIILLALLTAPQIHASVVRVDTQLGSFYIDLLENDAPNTVANFLNYVRDGDYANTYSHRVVQSFVIQGGGFTFLDGEFGEVPVDAAIVNEFNLSNLRGTVAMAKLANDPDSATSQWFINLDDSNVSLDTNNGGFTVFGRVMGDGMKIVDRISSLAPINLGGGALGEVPLVFNGIIGSVDDITQDNLIMTTITEVDGFEINPGLSGTWFNAATPGQGWLVDVIDSGDRKEVFIAWFTYDVNAPASDEGAGFGSTQHRWFTASGTFTGDTAALTISRNTGGVFNDPAPTTTEAVGTMTVQFADCTNGILAFDFDDEAITDDMVNITRLSPDAFCTSLAIPAQ
ncbi:MAG: peptidylprolyl isomerase [Lysobacterales bacterium]